MKFLETFIVIPIVAIVACIWIFFWLMWRIVVNYYDRFMYRVRKFLEPIPQEPWL